MNIQWKAEQYTQSFSFVPRYGENVLEYLPIRPGMTVLDLGCGNGQLTSQIAARGAKVIGMDASQEMLGQARAQYPELSFVQGEAESFVLQEPVDAVFSNAVFHWIDNQDALFRSINRALKPGGLLAFEMGGQGCAETIHRALESSFAARGYRYRRTQFFPTIGEYAPILERHHFRISDAALFDRDTPVVGADGVGDWIRMFLPLPFLREGIEPAEKEEIIRETTQCVAPALLRKDGWHVDYVRLRMRATKCGED